MAASLPKDNSLDRHLEHAPAPRKRKRDDGEIPKSIHVTFEATTLSEESPSQHLAFALIVTIPRSTLPLVWLEPNPSEIQPALRILFRTTTLLCSQIQPRGKDNPSLSIVRLSQNGQLYAVENIGGNTYMACLLAAWVTEEYILARPAPLLEGDLLEKLLRGQQVTPQTGISSKPNSQNVASTPPFGHSPKKARNRRGVLARMSILPEKEKQPRPQQAAAVSDVESQHKTGNDMAEICAAYTDGNTISSAQPSTTDANTLITQDLSHNPVVEKFSLEVNFSSQQAGDCAISTDPQVLLDTLHDQYLEMLYNSKTSLAYFAKGPLARARNQFQSLPSSAGNLDDLAGFYRDRIVPTKKMDLKYKDSIVEVLRALAPEDTPIKQAITGAANSYNTSKQKEKKKHKLGKGGLYPNEKDFIGSWWNGRALRDSHSLTAESQRREQKSLLADLRSRETEMQILLVLEALALESAAKAILVGNSTNLAMKRESDEQGPEITLDQVPQFKKKRKQDLKSELDLLADRLCIWHAIGLEGVTVFSDENQATDMSSRSISKDKLRDFCIEVIIPFYSGRLADECKAVCQKLGGPDISPKRPRAVLARSLSSSKIQPGAAMKAPRASIPKRTLQRVLSEDQGSRHSSPPVLSRSSTIPLLATMKREPAESIQRPGSRGGMQKSRSFSNREIDLVSDARTQEAKQQKLAKLAKQKHEIDAAINALRKPNRSSAAKEIVDDIEGRRTDSAPAVRGHGQAVHVTATPKKARRSAPGQSERSAFTGDQDLMGDTRTKTLFIPSSGARPAMEDGDCIPPRLSTARRAVLSAIHETPSRELCKTSDPLGLGLHGPGIGSKSDINWDIGAPALQYDDDALVKATPSTNRLRPDVLSNVENSPLRMRRTRRPVLFPPPKKSDVTAASVYKDAPEIPEKAGKAMDRVMGIGSEASIYDSLGWNDDF